jgi:large subunit ribosomal protein L41
MVFTTAIAFARRARRVGFNTLTTKMAKKGFYKGKGAISPGIRTSKGSFVLVPWKRPDYIVPPGLAVTSLKPYVETTTPKR